MIRFSRRGDRVTDFERLLVSECDVIALTDIRAVWLSIARRIGIDQLAIVLDELGTEKVHVPSRENFFGMLWQRQRDAEIVRRLGNGEPAADIARDYGMSVRVVRHVGQRSRQDDAARPGMVERSA